MPRAYDAAVYWSLGEQVATGDVAMRAHPVAFRTPGYPWLLGLFQSIGGRHSLWLTVTIQSLAVWLTTVLTGWWTTCLEILPSRERRGVLKATWSGF